MSRNNYDVYRTDKGYEVRKGSVNEEERMVYVKIMESEDWEECILFVRAVLEKEDANGIEIFKGHPRKRIPHIRKWWRD